MTSKIEKLEKEIIDLKIAQHKKNYIHIPIPNYIFFLGILTLLLAIGNGFLIYNQWIGLALGDLECSVESCNYNFNHIPIIWTFLGEYLLISLTEICFTASYKGGFDKLKKFNEEGLLAGLIDGLLAGLIAGLLGGLIFGLIFGLIAGLLAGLLGGLIFGLIGEIGEFD